MFLIQNWGFEIKYFCLYCVRHNFPLFQTLINRSHLSKGQPTFPPFLKWGQGGFFTFVPVPKNLPLNPFMIIMRH